MRDWFVEAVLTLNLRSPLHGHLWYDPIQSPLDTLEVAVALYVLLLTFSPHVSSVSVTLLTL